MPVTVNPTRDKFGVPVNEQNDRLGILQPKLKNRFRVTFSGNFAGGSEARVMIQNVQSCTRPKVQHELVTIDSYNSKAFIHGKHEWQDITLMVRDEIGNEVTRLVGAQEQRQINHFQQTTPAAGNDYKFDMFIEVLDGFNALPTEAWYLEGCFFQNVDYQDGEYNSNEIVMISMVIKFDNATHYDGNNPSVGGSGNPFPDISIIFGGSNQA